MANKNIIDIAVLSQEINQPYKIDDNIPVFDLLHKTPVLSVENFLRLFYTNGLSNNFCVNNNKGALTGTKQSGFYYSMTCKNKVVSEPLINYISFKEQHVMRDECGDYDDSIEFNLKDSIFSAYSSPDTGIGVSPYCWTTCSRIELTEQLLKLSYIYNVCNVCCSLTFLDALESIISDKTINLVENSVVTFRVSVVFTNDNEYIKDVIVRFNYFVDLDTGREIIPCDIFKRLNHIPCFQIDCNNTPKGHIRQLNFIYSTFFNKNEIIGLRSHWTFNSDTCYYYSDEIVVINKMRILSKEKQHCETSNDNHVLFKMRIKVFKDYYEFFRDYGFVDQTKLCIELTTSTDTDYCIGDTINFSINDNHCDYPEAINKIFEKRIGCQKDLSTEEVICNPLILTVCKIC